ncbi:DUF3750 domain-containing protein [Salinisphaera sp.]|uniref:DUF3750 domain-containing protein n=1 Tax=Salinisphaera sp. TaxID=1914330 RepID=UPI000C63DD3F|nr:DUF3750 domain-containing protein [Salinisphaera sp.]MBS62410.1 hypothetical protein [Salinisphaera sp.]
MKRALLVFIAAIVFVVSGPVLMLASDELRMGQSWRDADRSSAQLAPSPASEPRAVVQVYAARAFSWRGIFAVHTWVATKAAGADRYTVHQVAGWNHPPLSSRTDIPDRRWVGATPKLLLDLRGAQAATAITRIEAAVAAYPYDVYRIWPGPNSNTFVAWLIRRVPALAVELPPTAIGKDYLEAKVFARAPSATGYQLSLYGALGILAAREEGIEINLFGLVWGIDPADLAIKWPGLGRIAWHDPEPDAR